MVTRFNDFKFKKRSQYDICKINKEEKCRARVSKLHILQEINSFYCSKITLFSNTKYGLQSFP